MKPYTTSQRLKEIMNIKGIKQIDILKLVEPICKKWNVKMGSNDLSQYVTGKVEPSQKKLSVLAEALGTNEVWLMGYDVPMCKSEDKLINNDFKQMDELDELLFSKAKELSDEDKKMVINIINAIKRDVDKEDSI